MRIHTAHTAHTHKHMHATNIHDKGGLATGSKKKVGTAEQQNKKRGKQTKRAEAAGHKMRPTDECVFEGLGLTLMIRLSQLLLYESAAK